MPNPLDRNALPDEDRMRTTTAWILQREPVLVRIAPLVVLLIVIGLGIWVATAQVSVYDSFAGRVSQVRSGAQSDTLEVQLDDSAASLAAKSTVLVTPKDGHKRIEASVLSVDESEGRATLVIASSSPVPMGAVAMRVNAGSRSLLSELVGTARAGGREP